jgi:uncharacterized protein
MPEQVVLWRRLDQPGHEAARLVFHDPFWQLSGNAVFAHEGRPCRLEYLVVCSSAWQTLHAKVTGWVGTRCVRLDVAADSILRWRLNGQECLEARGCVDLDLAFSPATNMLQIRRLAMAVGEGAEVKAVWLRFPELTLGTLVQTYRRLSETRYRYEAFGGAFATELELNAAGLVVRYPDLWEAEAGET